MTYGHAIHFREIFREASILRLFQSRYFIIKDPSLGGIEVPQGLRVSIAESFRILNYSHVDNDNDKKAVSGLICWLMPGALPRGYSSKLGSRSQREPAMV